MRTKLTTAESNERARERMRALREQRKRPCPACRERDVIGDALCRVCAGIKREARLRAAGTPTRRGAHWGMKREHPSMSHKTRTHRQDIFISPVGMNPNDQLTMAQKFPNGFVCNVRPEQKEFMEQAALELGFTITPGAPRNSMHYDSIGIYVSDLKQDPRRLIERFNDLKLAAWNAARAQGDAQ